MAEQEQWRVFCAIELPHFIREKVMAHSMRLSHAVPDARASWSRADNIHLTLKFLGEISLLQVERICEAASRSVKDFAPFRIVLEQTGVFPKHRQPRVLWIGINDLEGKLGELQARLEAESEKAGFPRESRPFHPHLTLARLRKPQDASRLAAAHNALEFEPAEIAVSELLVIRSELSREGSRYRTISRHPIGGRE